MSPLRSLLTEARRRRIFSAAAWSVSTAHGTLDAGRVGTRQWGGPELDGTELWDLASVTKPVVGLAVLALVDKGALALTDPLAELLPDYRGTDKAGITVAQLLAHTSGLPGGVPLYRSAPTRPELLDTLRSLPLATPPGTAVAYSSPGFILLGLLAETAAGRPLDAVVSQLVAEPLGLTGLTFTPDAAARTSAVSTEHCTWRGHLVTGEVHDENAVVLGGVAGHAGLFAPLADVERLGRALLRGGEGVLGPAAFTEMTRCHTDGLLLRRCLGWQGLDPVGSPVGSAPGPDSYGHTGFTGTSLWVDAVAGRSYVLLTNRVHPRRDGRRFPAVRRAFHHRAARIPDWTEPDAQGLNTA
ncbi:D-alanyl-D-alanine-carboxypeptidase/endopeptidase AmpH precursor [Streptomyces sp. YIM 130001]|uniref:serine hydrolase domain-containing protein n=1 Tax=Streptomyces sp. YIM 130001 TaxID=2259644 RepID=UPI000E649839|nr:serine hydrolase domain-containing protein [Streptomyces sp. YIM 130001]RII12302.1 D-alanyl-D-alanine-carboxypeptidase/endopeptidase AmpH precursor [Streptomyces sp. YIM 130001]